jgi:hypothetical protein
MYVIVYRRVYTDLVVAITDTGPGSQDLVLRVMRGGRVTDYGPDDLFPNGLSAGDIVRAWLTPEGRDHLAKNGFDANGFTNVKPETPKLLGSGEPEAVRAANLFLRQRGQEPSSAPPASPPAVWTGQATVPPTQASEAAPPPPSSTAC